MVAVAGVGLGAVAGVGLGAVAASVVEVPVEIGEKASNIPRWAQHFLDEKDLNTIQEAVRQAEMNTSGEIIPIIVRRSTFIGHLPILLTLIFVTTLMIAEIPRLPAFKKVNQMEILFLMFAFCFFLAQLLSRINWLQRWLTPKLDQAAQVDARAELEFHRSGITATAKRTGVLLFISLMERRAVILADQGISSKMPKETWADICQLMVESIGKGQTVEGICRGIGKSGELLAKEFPVHGENPNELSNQLILKE